MSNADNRIDLTPNMYVDDTQVANQATTPGMGVTQNASGGWDLRAAADAGQVLAIAATAQERGKSIGDAYGVNETLRVCFPNAGDLLNVLLASGQNVAVNAALEAANGGFFQAKTTGATLFYTTEAVNATGGAALVRVRGASEQLV